MFVIPIPDMLWGWKIVDSHPSAVPQLGEEGCFVGPRTSIEMSVRFPLRRGRCHGPDRLRAVAYIEYLDRHVAIQRSNRLTLTSKSETCRRTGLRHFISHVGGTCALHVVLIDARMSSAQIAVPALPCCPSCNKVFPPNSPPL
jgi:hypothetical protein